ncbi:MAG TPA: hypothetical protein V6D18_21325 [Thermosynechococcaceae cyanobacterium]
MNEAVTRLDYCQYLLVSQIVQCFRVVVTTHRTDFVVTNDLAQSSTQATQQACGFC